MIYTAFDLGNTAFSPQELEQIDCYATDSGINRWTQTSTDN